MKKIIAAAMVVAVFGLVGCSTDKESGNVHKSTVVKSGCKVKKSKSYVGKLGAERTRKDVAK